MALQANVTKDGFTFQNVYIAIRKKELRKTEGIRQTAVWLGFSQNKEEWYKGNIQSLGHIGNLDGDLTEAQVYAKIKEIGVFGTLDLSTATDA